MGEPMYDVVGMGNAVVDVLAHTDDAFLERHGIEKGAMTLIDEQRAGELHRSMPPAVEISGGSAANTMAGLASLGGESAFIGKVHDDRLGRVYAGDLRAAGVAFVTPQADSGPATGRCYVLITPDAQRTFQTYLGASSELGPADVDPSLIGGSRITYLEGYLYDRPAAKEAFAKACRITHETGGEVALSLSDPFCVDRHREDFRRLVSGHVDILFANEEEILSLYAVDELDVALDRVRNDCTLAAVTLAERGCVLVSGRERIALDAEPVDEVVDTTGAGDLFAAGFLFGHTRRMGLETAGRIGGIAASEIISHIGARPEIALSELVAQRLGW